ncbi:MAG: hypothetical protein KME42_14200 [Tildeniella nuda ZEHNDER 1965/U140]|nr:hypothetical protein [Tildeniella nuda ZEHNDER 1965/U140]
MFVKDELNQDAAMSETDRIVAAAKASIASKSANSGKGFTKDSTAATVAVTPEPEKEPTEEPEPVAPKVEPVTEVAAESVAVTASITADQLADVVSSAVQAAIAQHKTETDSAIASIKEQSQTQIDAAKAAEQEARDKAEASEASRLNLVKAFNLDKLSGEQTPVTSKEAGMPMVNRLTSTKSDVPIGSVKEFLELAQSLPKVVRNSQRAGQMVSYDWRELDAYTRDNKKQMIKDMESWGKGIGLFRGSNQITTDSATIINNIPGGFLETLSSMMRSNNRPAYVFWQFIDYQFDFAARMGSTIDIPRAAYITGPQQASDRLLSGGGVYYPIDAARQPVQTGIVPVTIKEWGLGKDSTAAPIGIPTFVEAYSMINLLDIVNRNLMHDFYAWEDQSVIEAWDDTSRVVYNNGGEVTTLASDVVATKDGTMTEDYLLSMFGYMQDLQIPTLTDGCYIGWLNSRSVTQLKKSFQTVWQASTPEELSDLTNILNPGVLNDTGKINGYVGNYGGFHLFTSNNWGNVSGRGLQTETIGVTAGTETRKNYFAGVNTIAKGVGMPVEIRQDSLTNFDRIHSFTWLEHSSGCIGIDVDGAGDTSLVPQQLRVIESRNTTIKQ